MTVDSMYAPERRDYADSVTGRQVPQLTDLGAEEYHRHPNPPFTPDGGQVVFSSNRIGTSNLYPTDWN